MKKIGTKWLALLISIVMFICSIQEIHAEESAYSHCETATSGSVTMKVEWNDPVLGQPTTFHVSATGGSGAYKFRMDAPSYTNPNEMAYESVADPSRGEWMNYTNECNSTDYSFTMTASGTYNFRFYLMDKAASVYYLRVSTYIQVSDSNHPSVRSIVQSAVAQCNNETDGSDFQKALWLHDWLLNQLEYDNTLKWSSAESALTRGLGTCQAYESAYSMLLSTAGIENAETRDTYDGHTWNAMKLDGEWYQVDCTWDDSSDNWYNFDQRRLYFGLTDELMAVAHPGHSNIYTVSGYGTRSTTLKNNYFVKSGETQQWADSYKDRIQNSLNSKQTQFSIQADNSTYPPSIYKIQNGIIAYVMNQNEWFLNGKKVTLVAAANDNKFDFTVTYPTECTKHDWDEGKVTTEPTCTKDGIKTYTCKNCATTKTETIKALGHDYSNEWTIDKAATCTEEGSKSHHCTRCDDKKDVSRIEKLNHSWQLTSTIKSTKDKEGKSIYTCSLCDEKREEVIPKLIGKWITNDFGKWYEYPDNTYENSGFKRIYDKTYYFENSGYVKINWLLLDNDWYFFGQDGVMKTGWYNAYYFDIDGKMKKNSWVGTKYVDSDGKLVLNSFTPDGYYVGADGTYLMNQWILVNGKYYYLDEIGKVAKNIWMDSYYLGTDGVMVTNRWIDDYWCGSDGKYVKSAWVDNNKYYVDAHGVYMRNRWIDDCYLNSYGLKVINTWIGDYWCGNDGKYVKSAWVDNNKYYVDAHGVYMRNRWIDDCYLNSYGLKVINTWIGDYWCGNDGKYVKSSWVDNNQYYVNNKGLYVAGSWQKDGVGWYYRVGNDYAKNITLNINGLAYKFDSRGYWVS